MHALLNIWCQGTNRLSGYHSHNPTENVKGEKRNTCEEICTCPPIHLDSPQGLPVLVKNSRDKELRHEQEHKEDGYGDSDAYPTTTMMRWES